MTSSTRFTSGCPVIFQPCPPIYTHVHSELVSSPEPARVSVYTLNNHVCHTDGAGIVKPSHTLTLVFHFSHLPRDLSEQVTTDCPTIIAVLNSNQFKILNFLRRTLVERRDFPTSYALETYTHGTMATLITWPVTPARAVVNMPPWLAAIVAWRNWYDLVWVLSLLISPSAEKTEGSLKWLWLSLYRRYVTAWGFTSGINLLYSFIKGLNPSLLNAVQVTLATWHREGSALLNNR